MQLQYKLRVLRKQHNLSQHQLAEQIGCTRSFVADIETGAGSPSMHLAIKIADFFGVPMDVLARDELELGDACPHCPYRTDT